MVRKSDNPTWRVPAGPSPYDIVVNVPRHGAWASTGSDDGAQPVIAMRAAGQK